MTFVRTFEDFRPPRRHDGIPFVSVVIEESATIDGAYSTIANLPLTPQDLDPAEPQSRDLTTAAALLDPGWYKLLWTDNGGNYFPTAPIFSGGIEPFINEDELGAMLGRDLSNDEGAFIAVAGACDMVRTFAEQTFNRVEGDEITMDGTGTDALLLPQLPVTSVASVQIDTTTVTDYVLNGNGILLRKSDSFSSSVWTNNLPPTIWPVGRQNIAVTYTHGYSSSELPRDVRTVALSIAARLLVQGVASQENVQGDSITYAVASTDLTSGEKAILRKYKEAR